MRNSTAQIMMPPPAAPTAMPTMVPVDMPEPPLLLLDEPVGALTKVV